jgi:hypothetical protein
MRRFLLALLLVSLGTPAFSQGAAIGPPNFAVCNQSVSFGPIDGAGGISATTQIVAAATTPVGPGATSPRIFVCGFTFTNTAASGTVRLIGGTGTNCASNIVNLTSDFSVGASQVTIYSTPPSIVAAQGSELCVKPSANTISGTIWFAQF